MNSKRAFGYTKADGLEGLFRAKIATINAVDADGDVVTPTTFQSGWQVPVASYGHQYDRPPIGKATIEVQPASVEAMGKMFMDTQAGADTFRAIVGMGASQEWSWGYKVKRSHQGAIGGKACRYLDEIQLLEISPVLAGASVGTRTLEAKSDLGGTELGRRIAAELLADAGGLSLSAAKRSIAALGGAGALADELDSVIAERELADLEQRVKAAGAGQSRAERFIADLVSKEFSREYALTMLDIETEGVAQRLFAWHKPMVPIDYCCRAARAWMLRPSA